VAVDGALAAGVARSARSARGTEAAEAAESADSANVAEGAEGAEGALFLLPITTNEFGGAVSLKPEVWGPRKTRGAVIPGRASGLTSTEPWRGFPVCGAQGAALGVICPEPGRLTV